MSNDEMRDFYNRYIAAANARAFDDIAELIHDDVTINGAPYKRGDVLASLKGFTDAMPDMVWHIEDLIIEDDRIAARLRDTGTPAKTLFGLDATGAPVEYTEFASYKVRDGRFAEMWFLMDVPTITGQLNK